MNKNNITFDEWKDLIVENLVTDDDIKRIVENEKLRQFIIEIRDTPEFIPCEKIIKKLIDKTQQMEV